MLLFLDFVSFSVRILSSVHAAAKGQKWILLRPLKTKYQVLRLECSFHDTAMQIFSSLAKHMKVMCVKHSLLRQ